MSKITLGFVGEEMDLLIRQGATFGPFEFQRLNQDGTPVDLTGKTIRGGIRKDAASPKLYALEFTITEPLEGKYTMRMGHEVTATIKAGATLSAAESRYEWDCEILNADNTVTPLYYGKVSVQKEVARA